MDPVTKTKVTEYAGIQGAMVDGVKDGEGKARIAIFDKPAGRMFSREEVIKSIGSDLFEPTVPVMMTYTFFTEEKTYGWKDVLPPKPPTGNDNPPPVAKFVAEKTIGGVQNGVGNKPASEDEAKMIAKMIAEKGVAGVQKSADGVPPKP